MVGGGSRIRTTVQPLRAIICRSYPPLRARGLAGHPAQCPTLRCSPGTRSRSSSGYLRLLPDPRWALSGKLVTCSILDRGRCDGRGRRNSGRCARSSQKHDINRTAASDSKGTGSHGHQVVGGTAALGRRYWPHLEYVPNVVLQLAPITLRGIGAGASMDRSRLRHCFCHCSDRCPTQSSPSSRRLVQHPPQIDGRQTGAMLGHRLDGSPSKHGRHDSWFLARPAPGCDTSRASRWQ
jgi:hypothetical protein